MIRILFYNCIPLSIQARDARNKILHKADMKLTNMELTDYISTLDNMLSDPKHLAGHPDAIRARQLLRLVNHQKNINNMGSYIPLLYCLLLLFIAHQIS